MKTIQFQIFHHQWLLLKGINPHHRHPCSHRFILRSKGFHHPRTFHLIQFHQDQTGHNRRGHQPHARRAQLPPNVIRSRDVVHSGDAGTSSSNIDSRHNKSKFPSRIFLDICSGSNRPLSTAVLAQGGDVCSVDILRCNTYDLLNDEFYLKLLRLEASGRVAYAACSPSCNEYSVLKLKPGGPPPLRSRECLDGFPHLTADELTRVQNSHTMLYRCCEILQVVFSAGGHGHLEQPPSAMSWLENCTQQWLASGGIYCINLAACAFDRNWPKSWLFASSFEPLTELACTCPHPPGHHPKLAGVRDDRISRTISQQICIHYNSFG